MKKKGFTLIELLAVIVVLAITVLIAIPIIANVIDKAKEGSAIDSTYGYIDTVEKSVALGQIDSTKGIIVPKDNELDKTDFSDSAILDRLSVKGTKPTYVKVTFSKNKISKALLCIDGYNIKYENKEAKIVNNKYCDILVGSNMMKENDSIIGNIFNSSLSEGENNISFSINGKEYQAHVYNYNGDQTWDDDRVFGNDADIGASGKKAEKMVVVKVNGDLTVNGTVGPHYNDYGGPKGFYVFVTGTLTINGTIDNSHGAYADGEEVYLWHNATYDNSENEYEFVPASGGVGGAKNSQPSTSKTTVKHGAAGSASTTVRGTGGGGSGGVSEYKSSVTSGKGGTGTSYSGGVGSGGVSAGPNNSYSSSDAPNDGGAGTNGVSYCAGSTNAHAGGGTGNPGGNGVYAGAKAGWGTVRAAYKGQNGTGGLLSIYANSIIVETTGVISANGFKGGDDGTDWPYAGGGSSGGGSINIFYFDSFTNLGTNNINALGGASNYNGGAGGNGSVTIGSIATGTFVPYS